MVNIYMHLVTKNIENYGAKILKDLSDNFSWQFYVIIFLQYVAFMFKSSIPNYR